MHDLIRRQTIPASVELDEQFLCTGMREVSSLNEGEVAGQGNPLSLWANLTGGKGGNGG